MKIGTKNEDAVLQGLSCKSIVVQMFDCGFFESRSHPWMAASPDASAVITVSDSHHAACVEVRTCVSLERIAAA
jgi:hypothetical protein